MNTVGFGLTKIWAHIPPPCFKLFIVLIKFDMYCIYFQCPETSCAETERAMGLFWASLDFDH